MIGAFLRNEMILIIFLTVQPSSTKFAWQIEVQTTNLLRLGVSPNDICTIFIQTVDADDKIPAYIANKYHTRVYSYEDGRNSLEKAYIPSIKPYGLYQFFTHNPKEIPKDYFYLDSDVVFKEIPNFNNTPVTATRWYGSDCSSYLDATYIESKGQTLVVDMARVIGVNPDVIYSLRGKSIGAQIIMSSPDPKYWELSYKGCAKLYKYFGDVEPKYKAMYAAQGRPNEYPIQRWVAQMFTDIFYPHAFGVQMVPTKELDFTWSSDSISSLETTKIYHDAGITEDEAKDHFFKGKYAHKSPFGENFDFVDKNSASWFYVQQILHVPN